MTPNNKSARDKGKNAERELAKIMSEITGTEFRRVPMSGALHQAFPFDIMKIGKKETVFDRVGNESKNTRTISIPDWVEQIKVASEDAGLFDPKWFIAFKYRGEFYFLLNRAYFDKLTKSMQGVLDSSNQGAILSSND